MFNQLRLLNKTADDMALFPGQVDYGNRPGLRWHRFLPGQFSGQGSLPEDASNTISEMMSKFEQQFGQYRLNKSTGNVVSKFRGMLFVIYAKDSAVSNLQDGSLPKELQETAQFVNDHSVLLPPNGTDKSVGTPFWITWNGGSYANLFPNQVIQTDRATSEEIRPVKSEGELAAISKANYFWGNLSVAKTGKGYSPVLENNGKTEKILRKQAPGNTSKFFIDDIAINMSMIAMPQGPTGPVTSARLTKLRAGDRDNPEKIEDQQRRLQIYNDAKENGQLYIIKSDEEGSLFAQNIIDSSIVYLSESQVKSILRPEQFGKPFYVKSAKGQGSSSEGPWRMSYDLIKHLSESDSPYGFKSLQQLRSFKEEEYQSKYNTPMHTPYEGFKIIMIGPVFSNPETMEGQTTTNPQFATHITSIQPGIESTDRIAVERNVKWVVLANEIRPNVGDLKNPWVRVQGKNERSQTFESAESAINYVMSQYVDMNVPGNANVLKSTAESVKEADKALKASQGQSLPSPSTPPNTAPSMTQSVPLNIQNSPTLNKIKQAPNISGKNLSMNNNSSQL